MRFNLPETGSLEIEVLMEELSHVSNNTILRKFTQADPVLLR
jgi:hypothetical protein